MVYQLLTSLFIFMTCLYWAVGSKVNGYRIPTARHKEMIDFLLPLASSSFSCNMKRRENPKGNKEMFVRVQV